MKALVTAIFVVGLDVHTALEGEVMPHTKGLVSGMFGQEMIHFGDEDGRSAAWLSIDELKWFDFSACCVEARRSSRLKDR